MITLRERDADLPSFESRMHDKFSYECSVIFKPYVPNKQRHDTLGPPRNRAIAPLALLSLCSRLWQYSAHSTGFSWLPTSTYSAANPVPNFQSHTVFLLILIKPLKNYCKVIARHIIISTNIVLKMLVHKCND